tara:strand:- start:123 stop:350 length:228 start_codon:yes stop_codon:yes gene_type:complete
MGIYDSVQNPKHYCEDKIESLDYIKQQLGKQGFMAYCVGNMHKYLHRHEKKGENIQDLKKLIFYANEKINVLENL